MRQNTCSGICFRDPAYSSFCLDNSLYSSYRDTLTLSATLTASDFYSSSSIPTTVVSHVPPPNFNEVVPSNLSIIAIIGIVMAGVLLFALALYVLWYFCHHSRQHTYPSKAVPMHEQNIYPVPIDHMDPSLSTLVCLPSTFDSTRRDETFTDMQFVNADPMSSSQDLPHPNTSKYVVTQPFMPTCSDEIKLEVGDIILVDRVFDDQWAVGMNETSGLEGVFHMACVEPVIIDSEATH